MRGKADSDMRHKHRKANNAIPSGRIPLLAFFMTVFFCIVEQNLVGKNCREKNVGEKDVKM
ncbi:MAG: hypothetical protein EAZ92_16640 [Candidatus Kapaibacterium sp.]|nr:MAG: hypothetical protein EAZ92_16640 [Candidatus Kapabacteria bacterium]